MSLAAVLVLDMDALSQLPAPLRVHEHMCPTCLAFWPCEVGGCDDGLFGPCAPCAALLEE